MRLYGLGLMVFVRNKWNIFDVIVVVGILGTTIPLIYYKEDNPEVSPVNFHLQKVRPPQNSGFAKVEAS